MTIGEIKVGDWFTIEASTGIFIKTDNERLGLIWGVNLNNGIEIPFYDNAKVTVIKRSMGEKQK